IRNTINNYLNNPKSTIPSIVQDELNQRRNVCSEQITSILNDLKACVTHPLILGDLGADLASYCNTNGIDFLTPGALRSILIGRLGSITDLCQPFVAKFKVFEPDAAASSDYISRNPS